MRSKQDLQAEWGEVLALGASNKAAERQIATARNKLVTDISKFELSMRLGNGQECPRKLRERLVADAEKQLVEKL